MPKGGTPFYKTGNEKHICIKKSKAPKSQLMNTRQPSNPVFSYAFRSITPPPPNPLGPTSHPLSSNAIPMDTAGDHYLSLLEWQNICATHMS